MRALRRSNSTPRLTTQNMATTIATLAAKLSLDNKAFLAGFKQSISASKSFASSIGTGISGAVSSMGAGIAASLSLAAAVGQISQSMEHVDRVAKLADRLGLSNEAMQRMSVIAKSGNVDVEMLAKAMLTMGRNIGTGGKSLDQRFFDVADSIAAIKDPAERSKRAVEIFGKEGNELLNILSGGSRNLRETSALLDRFGLSISRVDAAKVESANDAWGRMGILLDGISDKIAVGLSPTMEAFANRSIALIDGVNAALERMGTNWEGIGKVIGATVQGLSDATVVGLLGRLVGSDPAKPSTPNKPVTPFNLNSLDDPAKKFKSVRPGALERGSMEAVRAMQNNGRSTDTAQKQLLALEAIRDFVDPMKRPDAPRLVAGAL